MSSEHVHEYGYRIGPNGVGPGKVTITCGDGFLDDLRKKGVDEEGIMALKRGKMIVVDETPTPFGIKASTTVIDDKEPFPARLYYGDVLEHPLTGYTIVVYLKTFGSDLGRDRITVSDARHNTKHWSADQLQKLAKEMEEYYPGARLI